MKKSILTLAFLLVGIISFSQPSFSGFFRPVPKDLPNGSLMMDDTAEEFAWLFRPTVGITALQLAYNKDTKKFDASPLSSIGPGIGLRHYVMVDGKPYNNYGFNVIALLGYTFDEENDASIGLIGTFNFMEYINLGGGYNFTHSQFIIITGAVVKF